MDTAMSVIGGFCAPWWRTSVPLPLLLLLLLLLLILALEMTMMTTTWVLLHPLGDHAVLRDETRSIPLWLVLVSKTG